MSKYILVQAYTNSEWDSVSFALIELTEEHLKFLKEAQQKAISIKEEGDSFCHISYSGDMAEFYIDEDELPEGIMLNEDNPIVVEMNEDDVKVLTQPEQNIRYGEMRVGTGALNYVGLGKHTSEEYWTENIPFDLIFK